MFSKKQKKPHKKYTVAEKIAYHTKRATDIRAKPQDREYSAGFINEINNNLPPHMRKDKFNKRASINKNGKLTPYGNGQYNAAGIKVKLSTND